MKVKMLVLCIIHWTGKHWYNLSSQNDNIRDLSNTISQPTCLSINSKIGMNIKDSKIFLNKNLVSKNVNLKVNSEEIIDNNLSLSLKPNTLTKEYYPQFNNFDQLIVYTSEPTIYYDASWVAPTAFVKTDTSFINLGITQVSRNITNGSSMAETSEILYQTSYNNFILTAKRLFKFKEKSLNNVFPTFQTYGPNPGNISIDNNSMSLSKNFWGWTSYAKSSEKIKLADYNTFGIEFISDSASHATYNSNQSYFFGLVEDYSGSGENIDYGVNVLYLPFSPPHYTLLYVLHNGTWTGIPSPTGDEYGGYNHGDRFKIIYNNTDKTMKLINMTQDNSVKNSKTLTDDFINTPRPLLFAAETPAYLSGIKFVDIDKI